MIPNRQFRGRIFYILVMLSILALASPLNAAAKPADAPQAGVLQQDPAPYVPIPYEEIEPRIREIERNSNRVKVDVIGQSAGGRDLFLVTLSDPQAMGRLGQYQAIRQTMLKDPDKAQEMIDKFGDFKVPVFINASIHGNEYPGVDAAIRLIETLAYEDTPEVQEILRNVILLVNVVQNPDGRVLGTRGNANGFDINRDFITLSQPEARATVGVLTKWNPMVVLDLHGFVNPMLIEPCTPLHNPNYEYDLYIKWAYYQAEAMEAEVLARTGRGAQIPFRDFDLGWDDWPPTYTPMYSMYHGAYGHTLETPSNSQLGVDSHYAAVWGALKFVSQNRVGMIHDQIETFRRGFLDLPQMLIPDEILNETQFNQYNELTIKDFPAAYVIPSGSPYQLSEHQAARLVDFLLYNDVQVEQSSQAFTMNGVDYPAGTYVIWMDQPKRGLANTILEAGPDLSDIEGLFFYSPPSVWSNPLLWGVHREVMVDKIELQTHAVTQAKPAQGKAEGGSANAYAFQPTSLQAFQAVNDMLKQGLTAYRAPAAFTDQGRTFEAGTFVIPPDSSLANNLGNQKALEVFALKAMPSGLTPLKSPNLAVSGDEGVRHALRVLGFDFTTLSNTEARAGAVAGYDLYLNQSITWNSVTAAGRTAYADYFNAGGDYIGLRTGVGFAISAQVLNASTASAQGNAIVSLDYTPGDSVGAGFWPTDYAFVFTPIWFTSLGPDVEVTAQMGDGNFVVSGFWPGWQTSGANGAPVIVHTSSGSRDVTAIGIDATFRGHPENAFRLLGNAIFGSQEP